MTIIFMNNLKTWINLSWQYKLSSSSLNTIDDKSLEKFDTERILVKDVYTDEYTARK